MSDLHARVLDREDLVLFLSGQLLGFALDEYFNGAYLGAFDTDDNPAGFIFTGQEKPGGKILIGIPHILESRKNSAETIFLFLLEEAINRASVPEIIAAIYSDQTEEEQHCCKWAYNSFGFTFLNDNQIFTRNLELIPIIDSSLSFSHLDPGNRNLLLEIAKTSAAGSPWQKTDFSEMLSIWENNPRFDPDMFLIAFLEKKPVGVCFFRLDLLDLEEAAFYYLGVLPEYRRNGYGSLMINQTLKIMSDKKAKKTRQVIPANAFGAAPFLRSNGYDLQEWAKYYIFKKS